MRKNRVRRTTLLAALIGMAAAGWTLRRQLHWNAAPVQFTGEQLRRYFEEDLL